VLKSLASMSALNLVKALIQFGITSAVSLFVLPHEYGLIAFSTPIISFIALFTDMGLSSAVVRKSGLDRTEAGEAFTCSLCVALGASLMLALAAWPLQKASHLDGLAPLLLVLTLAVLFNIAAAIPRALLERHLRYQTVAAYEFASLLVAATSSLAVLFCGGRIWAVVVNQVVLQLLRMALFWIASRHELALNFGWKKISGLLGFGGWVLATNVLAFFARNADNLLIGTFLGATAVGIYGLAYQFMTLPLMAITWPASGVLLATLSSKRHAEGFDINPTIVGVTQATALISFPLMTFMAVGLSFPVDRLLSPHWHQVVNVIGILAFAGAIQSIGSYNGAVLLAVGRPRVQFLLSVCTALVLIAGFLLALPYGIIVFAKVYVISTIVTTLIVLAAMIHFGGIEPLGYLRSLMLPIAGSLVGLGGFLVPGFHATNWAHWSLAVGIFGLGVALVYGMAQSSIRASLGVLLETRRTATA